MTNTVRASYVFTVKEFADGTPWIMAEPLKKNTIKFNGDGFLGFDLPKDIGMGKANEIAKFLNDNLEGISLTTF